MNKKISSILAAVIVVLVANLAPVYGQTNVDTISEILVNAQNSMLQAVKDYRASGQADATADIAAALDSLQTVLTALNTDPSLQTELGTLLSKVTAGVLKAQASSTKAQVLVDTADPFKKSVAVVKGITSAAKSIYSCNLSLGKPLLAEVNPSKPTQFSKSAGFHNPGDLVTFQIDMAGCSDTPTITVQNASSMNQSVVLSSVAFDSNTGLLSFLMGPDEGGARVQVTACGVTRTMLLYNYGNKTAQKLPYGFPLGIETGTYSVSVSGTICAIYTDGSTCWTDSSTIGPISMGTFPMVSVTGFAKALTETASTIATSFNEPNGQMGSQFTPVVGGSFSWTVSVSGSAWGCSCTATATLTIQKL